MNPTQPKTGVSLHSHLTAGTPAGDNCYVVRNWSVMECALRGWPQYLDPCAGNNMERNLKACLYKVDDHNWWKAFPECTSAKQCYNTRPAYTDPIVAP